MADEVPDNIKKVAKELYHEVDDNIQFNDDKNQIRFAKLRMSAEVVDFLMEHYGFFDFVELNQICLYIMKCLAHMEKDGWQLTVIKSDKDKKEMYGLDIHQLIAQFRVGMADAITKNKDYNPNVSTGKEGIENESN